MKCYKLKTLIVSNLGEFIRVNDETRYLVLFGPEKHDVIYNKIRYGIRIRQ